MSPPGEQVHSECLPRAPPDPRTPTPHSGSRRPLVARLRGLLPASGFEARGETLTADLQGGGRHPVATCSANAPAGDPRDRAVVAADLRDALPVADGGLCAAPDGCARRGALVGPGRLASTRGLLVRALAHHARPEVRVERGRQLEVHARRRRADRPRGRAIALPSVTAAWRRWPRNVEGPAAWAAGPSGARKWWATQDSNLRLPPCEGGTLPLS